MLDYGRAINASLVGTKSRLFSGKIWTWQGKARHQHDNYSWTKSESLLDQILAQDANSNTAINTAESLPSMASIISSIPTIEKLLDAGGDVA